MTEHQKLATALYKETKTAYEIVYDLYNPTLRRWYDGKATRAEFEHARLTINAFLTACELASREIEYADAT